MIKLGIFNDLKVQESKDNGYVLTCDEGESTFLHNKETAYPLTTEDEVSVFVYRDKNGKSLATLKKPKITLNQFAYLEVVETTYHGAFMDWGIQKDLFVPSSRQLRPLSVGDYAITYLSLIHI